MLLTFKDCWVPVYHVTFSTSANAVNLDYMCNTYLNEATSMLHVKAIANAESFEMYMQQDPYDEYYNHFTAINDEQCWVGEDATDKISKIIEEHSWKSF